MRKLVPLLAIVALLASACGDSNPVGVGPVTTQTVPDAGTAPPATTAPPTTAPPGGDTTTTSTTTTVPAATRTVSIYLFDDDPAGPYLVPVERAIPDTPEVGTNSLQALLSGPTPAEQPEFSSEIPAETLLLGLAIADGLATVDLSREFEAGGGTFSMTGRLAQVVYTVTQFPTVDRVEFRLDGRPVSVFSGEGIMLDEPVDRSDYRDLLRPGFDDTPVAVPQRWEQDDLPATAGVPPAELSRVVLVASDDVLNVRSGAGVDNEVVGMLAPTVTVRRTGRNAPVGRSTWAELVTPDGTGWVNATFLGAVVDEASFAADPAARSRLDDLAEIVATDGDLRDIVSERGLYVAHHAGPRRFNPDELAGILTDSTTYQWPSNAADLEDVPFRTFAEAVADRYLQAYDDPDVVVQPNEPIEAGNGRPAEFAIPFEFQNFNYFTVYDPGDNPDFGGLDWTIWYVSIDYEDGRPVIVGLTLDEWAP